MRHVISDIPEFVDPGHNPAPVIDLSAISTIDDLTPEAVVQAAGSSQELKRLITRVAEIAQPEAGWTRLYKVLSHVAVADWMEGDLQVDFNGDDKGTTLSFYAVLGAGIRERLFSPQYVAVPIDEFQRAVVLNPAVVAPLRAHQGLNRMTLAAGARVRNNEVAVFELEEKSLGDGERITAPPPADLLIDEPEVHTRPTLPPRSE